MSLARVEGDKGPGAAGDEVVAAPDLGLALDDDDPGALANLVVAERLAGLEPDRDGSRAVVRRQDGGVDRAPRCLDLGQRP